MKRTLVIAVLIMLLLSSTGVMAAGAAKPPVTPPAKSGIYQFAVLGVDEAKFGEASGKLTVNAKAGTYTFSGRNAGEDGTSYDLYYVIGGVETKFASGPAKFGIVGMSGQLPAGVDWSAVTGAVVKLTPTLQGTSGITITNFDSDSEFYNTYWLVQVNPKWTGQTGTVTGFSVNIYDANGVRRDGASMSGGSAITSDEIDFVNYYFRTDPRLDKTSPTPYKIIMTVTDDLGTHTLPAEENIMPYST